MKKTAALCTLAFISLLLQACSNQIPPSRIQYQNDPGKIQRVAINPLSPHYKQYMAHP